MAAPTHDAPAGTPDGDAVGVGDSRTGRSLFGYPVVLPNRRDPRLRLAAVTTSLHVLGQTTFGFNLSIAQILVSLLAAAVVEFGIVLVRDHKIAWPASALLTGNSVALILRVPGTEHGDWWTLRGWWIFAATSALAVASKYLIRWKGAHFFNPSNLMLVLTFVLLGESRVDPQILWWGPWSVGLALGFGVILGGSIAVTHHVRQLHTALAFWAPFAILMAVLAASGHAITTNWHVGPLAGWPYWVTLVLSPEVMVFAFFMITDPKASPVTDRGKVIFGFTIALLSAAFVATQSGEFGTKVGILAGLVVLCPAIPFINARTGAPATPVPTGRPFIPTPDGTPTHTTPDGTPDLTAPGMVPGAAPATPPATPPRMASTAPTPALLRSFTPRQVVLAAVALVVVAAGIHTTGSRLTYQDPAGDDTADTTAALDRRGEATLDITQLPPVELDDDATRSAFRLTPEVAERIAHDTVLDLLLEAQAVSQRDQQLATAGVTGKQLADVTAAIDRLNVDRTVPPPAMVGYTIDSLTVTLFKPDDGPQTPPELAVHVTGTASGTTGSVAMDTIFTVTPANGSYLISGAFDTDRAAVPAAPLDPRIAGDAAVDPDSAAPVAEATTPVTMEELAGLALVDRAAEMGLTLPHSRYGLGEGQDYRIGGAAVGDVDGDGYPDIYLTRVGYPNVLYRNDGGNGFTDVTTNAGLSDAATTTAIDGGSTAAAFVDLDGDGHLDLITLGMTGTPDTVHLGDGNGHFTDATAQWLPATAAAPEPASTTSDTPTDSLPVGIALSDFDGDGRVDLLILASEPQRITEALDAALGDIEADGPDPEVGEPGTESGESEPEAGERRPDADGREADSCGPDVHAAIDSLPSAPSGTRLLRNTGSGFTDATDRLGVDPSRIAANSARFVDVDGDGHDDLVIAGSSCTTKVLINDGGRFVDRTAAMGFDRIPHAAAVALLDVDHNGRNDLFLSGISYPSASGRCDTGVTGFECSTNRLMVDRGDGSFEDAADQYQVRHSGWSWAPTAVDLNNDGFDDLYVSTGMRSVDQWWNDADPDAGVPYDWSTSPDRLWLGVAEGPMRVTENLGGEPLITRSPEPTRGRATIAADFDRDGRMDLLVIDTAGPPALLMNTTGNDNHWLGITTTDAKDIGATITVQLADGRTITRRIGVEGSYQSGGPTAVHIGLGSASTVERLTVTRTDGSTQVIGTPPVDRWTTLDRQGLR